MQFGAVLGGERHVGEHVVLAVVHQSGELGPARSQLVGDVPPGLMRGLGVGCRKAWRIAAATIVCWPFGTWASALRIKCTRQLCQVAPEHLGDRGRKPSWASEITSLTPLSPRFSKP